ncbi:MULTISPECIES: UDP-glucose/GDP-mannose dehydrogenase family protein [unclassified Saccharibacter]|uniref:UDP-glucose dehydrogenase family protein n=1 Tax=unclassified Saccharibacter TaxID=2648722 RepID=UPI00132414F7|nr:MULTISPECIES: UDP-glucose/GDP-mannose dehydrogenase family protein [unclassified Saccharibacter]MXV36499.1 nucleotide sugar dehydrogenase [Saccharibacter sp. EH611]MXV57661.1 nucleotide sugar dehydrogenase [Saccharibacter sp. EH70]MXV65032.1 nucleotide sugar dehydrogenase [Saccharibacter sp. EH60]
MKIAIIGGGYVGLVSGACLATFGASVTIVDRDPARFAQLQSGHVPIYEPGLDALFSQEARRGTLRFSADMETALAECKAVFIAVGTPTRRGSGHADLSYVYAVAHDIAKMASHSLLVVTKSTVPVGTGREVSRILRENRPDLSFHIASNPEFLREGNAIDDFIRPDRVIIGLDQQSPDKGAHARAFLTKLYHPLTTPHNRLTFMGLESAELTKYAANAFLAMKVTFANEMADLCEATGADIREVTHGMGQDPRIGPDFLTPGPGYGGSCFPKDTRALATSARKAGTPTQLIDITIAANEARKQRLADRILSLLDHPIHTKIIAVLGLTFKAHTDDMRDAPALSILPALHEAGARLQLFDPQGMDQARPLLPQDIPYADSALNATKGADVVLILTEWPLFKELTPHQLSRTMKGRLVLDYRGIWEPRAWRDAGFTYHRLGCKNETAS